MIPTYVVIPVERGQREEMTARLVGQLGDYPIRLDDSGLTITRKWNAGLDWAKELARFSERDDVIRWHNVAVLNNDIQVSPAFLEILAAGLRSNDDNCISYPDCFNRGIPPGWTAEAFNPGPAGQTMSGWAFMVRGEPGLCFDDQFELRFDEQFEWWYGDSDMEKQVRAQGKHVVCVGGCYARHLEPNRSTFWRPELLAAARRDEARFAAKWRLDPATLFFARYPQIALQSPKS